MDKLTRIFGIIVPMFLTNNGGVSISEVSRRQAEAKQQNDEFWGKIADAVSGIFQKVLTFVGAGSAQAQPLDVVTVTTDDIRQYRGVAERNAETAVLMHGVKLYKRLQEQLQRMDLRLFVVDALPAAPALPVLPVIPAPPKAPQSATTTEDFMELNNIDEMIAALKPGVLAKFDFAFFRQANQLNARAAAIGKLLSEQGSFFRQLIKPLPKGSEQVTQTGALVTSWKKTYSGETFEQFSKLRDELQAEYNILQQQLNGLKKQLKDAVREHNLHEERLYQADYRKYQLQLAEHQTAVKQLTDEHQHAVKQHAVEMEHIRSSAELLRQQALQEIAKLKVRVE